MTGRPNSRTPLLARLADSITEGDALGPLFSITHSSSGEEPPLTITVYRDGEHLTREQHARLAKAVADAVRRLTP